MSAEFSCADDRVGISSQIFEQLAHFHGVFAEIGLVITETLESEKLREWDFETNLLYINLWSGRIR